MKFFTAKILSGNATEKGGGALANNEHDELIRIKKHEKKEKPKKEKKERPEKQKREKKGKINATPRANGVKLDFTQEKPEVNRYWLSVSKRYRVCRYASIFLLVAFLLVMLLFYRENITYANLVYLVRDLDSSSALDVGGYSDISYDRITAGDFDLFRSRIAVASQSGFTLYSSTGGTDLESEDVIADPRLEVSEKYALVYGAGEKEYSVYTTVARVLHTESEFEIEDAALSNTGSYALLTRSLESRFLITVYDSAFRDAAYYYKDNFVMDIALDSKGENLAAVSVKADGAGTVCEVMLGEIGKKESTTFEYSGMMPLCCEYTEDGSVIVLCDSALLVFNGEKETARVDFKGMIPDYFDVERNTVALSFSVNAIGSESILCVYDTKGEELYSKDISGKAVSVATDGTEAVYCVTEETVYRLSLEDGKTKKEKTEAQVIHSIAVPGSLILFTPEGTVSRFS